jgi:hypothetical protein
VIMCCINEHLFEVTLHNFIHDCKNVCVPVGFTSFVGQHYVYVK